MSLVKTVDGMKYERAGSRASKRDVVEQGMFKDLTTLNMCVGVTKELYRRFDTEIYAVALFVTYGVIIWHKLGL